MNHIILIGLPNCGKTTLGKRAAQAMNMPFYDTDEMAVEKMGRLSVSDIFRPSSQLRYYQEEQNAIIDIASQNVPAIVSTGAEITLIPKCALLLPKMGTVILIN
jgi:shikimate kinase